MVGNIRSVQVSVLVFLFCLSGYAISCGPETGTNWPIFGPGGLYGDGVQGPFPPYVSVLSDAEFSGDLPIEISVYITYDGIEEATLMIDWGDGGGWEPAVPNEESNLFLHTYAIERTYTIRVKAQAGSTQLTDSLEITIASP
jgi:hypothetical protein